MSLRRWMQKASYRRIIACVDGTWYNADGQTGNSHGNTSNVFRIYASIKQGKSEHDGVLVDQIAEYFPGIGVNKNKFDTWNDAITGEGCEALIREVYEFCCGKVQSEHDELWFFGFSRGAYVVQAVAALFHGLSAAIVAPENGDFMSTYRQGLNFLNARHKGQISSRKGELYHFLASKTQKMPVIKFLGLFDTVKKAPDRHGFDLSYNESIQRIRHALALNEDRYQFLPEVYDIPTGRALADKSLVQAWFLGSHMDIGGGAQHDGLSLYPLQWMLLECQDNGLILGHRPIQHLIEDPLKLVSLEDTSDMKMPRLWEFPYSNGITVKMRDVRRSHDHRNVQSWTEQNLRGKSRFRRQNLSSHKVRLNPGKAVIILRNGSREERLIRTLENYHTSTAAYGSLVHPSVYFLLDHYRRLIPHKTLETMCPLLQEFRSNIKVEDPWVKERQYSLDYPVFRILIIGNAGVGKSTLLNKVFGVPMSMESEDKSGKHDINAAFELDQHPGLIIHDSEGFQAGDDQELMVFENFLKERSETLDPDKQLNAIWLCIESHSVRPVQKAEKNVLTAISKFGSYIPLTIIGTKTDELFLVKKADGPEAQGKLLQEKKSTFEQRLHEECADFDALEVNFAFVSKDDKASITDLVNATVETLHDEGVYGSMVRVQVANIDRKVEVSIDQTLKHLRSAITAETWSDPLIVTSAIVTPAITWNLCGRLVHCFGVSPAHEKEVDAVLNKIILSNVLRYLGPSIGQGVAFWADLSNGTVGPSRLTAEAPAGPRMLVKCACDAIMILQEAFRLNGKAVKSEDVKAVASRYRGSRSEARSTRSLVHEDINNLMGPRSLELFQSGKIEVLRSGLRRIIQRHKFAERVDSPMAEIERSETGLSVEIVEDKYDLKEIENAVMERYMTLRISDN